MERMSEEARSTAFLGCSKLLPLAPALTWVVNLRDLAANFSRGNGRWKLAVRFRHLLSRQPLVRCLSIMGKKLYYGQSPCTETFEKWSSQ
jgi:hypothetical protein